MNRRKVSQYINATYAFHHEDVSPKHRMPATPRSMLHMFPHPYHDYSNVTSSTLVRLLVHRAPRSQDSHIVTLFAPVMRLVLSQILQLYRLVSGHRYRLWRCGWSSSTPPSSFPLNRSIFQSDGPTLATLPEFAAHPTHPAVVLIIAQPVCSTDIDHITSESSFVTLAFRPVLGERILGEVTAGGGADI